MCMTFVYNIQFLCIYNDNGTCVNVCTYVCLCIFIRLIVYEIFNKACMSVCILFS